MRKDLIERLKDCGVDDDKIAALIDLGIDDGLAESMLDRGVGEQRRLEDMAKTMTKARYKGATLMSAKPGSTASSEADQFVATLKAARIPEKYEDTLWDIWVDDPPRATRMARAYTPPVRTKAAPGMQSIELPAALASAITRARAQFGDTQLAQILGGASPVDAVMAELGGKPAGVGTLSSDQKPPSREAKARTKERRKGMAALFDEGIQEYNR